MSRGIDPMQLSFDRFLNLCHFVLLSNFDSIVYMVDPEKYAVHTRNLTTTLIKGGQRPGEPPPWWDGDEEATQSGLLAARQLGMRVE